MRGIIDTNLVIHLDRIAPALIPDEPAITAITLAELSIGPLATDDEHERASRQARLQEAEAIFEPLPFDAAAARAYGRVAASLRRAGRKPQARAFDALIAATALSQGLGVWTCNPNDFEGIEGLTVVAVRHPDR